MKMFKNVFKDDGDVDTTYTEITTVDAIKEIEIFSTRSDCDGSRIGFTNDKNETIRFNISMVEGEDDWSIEVPIIKEGKYIDQLTGDGLSIGKVKEIVEKFFNDGDWKSVHELKGRDENLERDWELRRQEYREKLKKIEESISSGLHTPGKDYLIYLHPRIPDKMSRNTVYHRLTENTPHDVFFVEKKARDYRINIRTKHRRASEVVQRLENEDPKKIKSEISGVFGQQHPGFASYTTRNKDIIPILEKVVSAFDATEYMKKEELVWKHETETDRKEFFQRWTAERRKKEAEAIKIIKNNLYASGTDYEIYVHPTLGRECKTVFFDLSKDNPNDCFFIQKTFKGCTIRMGTKHRRVRDVIQKLEKVDTKNIPIKVYGPELCFGRYRTRDKDIAPILKNIVSGFEVDEYMDKENLVRKDTKN
ncbi:MAG: hypothetical protein WC974_02255 [Thermoplasmata archaeon]